MKVANNTETGDIVLKNPEEQKEEVVNLVIIANAVVQQIGMVVVANDATVALRTVVRSQRSSTTTFRAHSARQLLVSLLLAQQILTLLTLHI